MSESRYPILLLSLVLACSLFAAEPPPIVQHADTVTSGPFVLEHEAYRGDLSNLPIGVFDSGVGGLTVLEAILGLDEFDNGSGEPGGDGVPDFERERFVYLGDQANMPYGNYSGEDKTDFLRELVVKDALFLLGSRYWPARDATSPSFDKPPVKAIVIACNTATAYGYDDVKAALEQWGIPVYLVGVVNAGARGAYAAMQGDGAVAVMATVGTCASEGYVRAVGAAWGSGGQEPPPVIQQGCLGLAGAIEGDRSYINATPSSYKGPSESNPAARIEPELETCYGFDPAGLVQSGDSLLMINSVENYIRYHTLTLVENYAAAAGDAPEPISGVILGCTHFPFYTGGLEEAFGRLRSLEVKHGGSVSHPYAGLLAEHMVFIDPAKNTATELYTELNRRGLLLEPGERCAAATDEFYISVAAANIPGAEYENGAFSYSYKYGREPGDLGVEYVRRVPMTAATLSPESIEMVRGKLPLTWARLAGFNDGSLKLKSLPESQKLH